MNNKILYRPLIFVVINLFGLLIELQQFEKDLSKDGYTGIKHQQEVGGNYYEKIGEALLGDDSELLSEKDSTESTQF